MLRWTLGFSHMAVFMAGHSSRGQVVAISVVVTGSSHRPLASFPSRSAVAGATMARSAERARSR